MSFSLVLTNSEAIRFLGHQISWVSDLVCDFSPCASSAVKAAKETKFSRKVA